MHGVIAAVVAEVVAEIAALPGFGAAIARKGTEAPGPTDPQPLVQGRIRAPAPAGPAAEAAG
jgi:hypothetical protein